MLYVYYSAFKMLVGAEMNQVIERHFPGGKSEGDQVAPPTNDPSPAVNLRPTTHTERPAYPYGS